MRSPTSFDLFSTDLGIELPDSLKRKDIIQVDDVFNQSIQEDAEVFTRVLTKL